MPESPPPLTVTRCEDGRLAIHFVATTTCGNVGVFFDESDPERLRTLVAATRDQLDQWLRDSRPR